MANIKFSQFTEKTTLGTVDFLVGYTGAENVQISPTNLLSTFVSGSGTNGQVAYFDPSNNLAGENDFFWDYTNNRLGIGTTSPTADLYVSGSNADATDKPTMISESVFTVKPVALNSGNLNFAQVDNGSAIGMQYTNGAGTANWSISMQPFGGNVGIGTITPVSKLDVIGGVTAQGTLVATGISQLGSSGANVYLTSSSAGNVGIGTSSPSSKLDVKSSGSNIDEISLTHSGNTAKIASLGQESGHGSLVLRNNSGAIQTRLSAGGNSSYILNSNVGIGTTSPATALEVNGLISGKGGAGWGYTFSGDLDTSIENPSANTIGFKTTGVERMRIDSSGNVDVNGNLAVEDEIHLTDGGSTVRGKLLLNSSDRDNVELRAESLGSTMKFFTVGTEALLLDSSQNATFAGVITYGNSTGVLTYGSDRAILRAASSKVLELQTNGGTTLMTGVNADATFAGNVTATNILTVAGAATGSPYLQFTQGGTQKAYIQYADSGDSFELQSDNQFVVRTGGSTAALTINSSQNATFAGTVTAGSYFLGDDAAISLATTGAGTVFLRPNGQSTSGQMKVESNGNATFAGNIVGDGDTVISTNTSDGSDNAYLSLTGGGANSDGRGARARYYGNEHASLAGVVDISTGNISGADMLLYSKDNIQLFTDSNERMRINSSGNASIGSTTNAGYRLKVEGTGTVQLNNRTGSDGTILAASKDGTIVGSITVTSSATAFNTSSDYRLKEDLQDFNGLDKVSKIPVYNFKWKSDESRSYGVMAHELQEVLPQAVTEEKDAEEMQGVDYSKIVPLLVKSIQELKSEIEELKSK